MNEFPNKKKDLTELNKLNENPNTNNEAEKKAVNVIQENVKNASPKMDFSDRYQETSEKTQEVKGDESDEDKIWKRRFITNDGEEITYDVAVGRIIDRVKDEISEINKERIKNNEPIISDDKTDAIVYDIRRELFEQEKAAEGRGIGDHGIRHIYGNIERSDKWNEDRGMTSEEKLAVIVAHVYHDEGYRDPSISKGLIDPDGKLYNDGAEKQHDELSKQNYWEKGTTQDGVVRKDLYEGVFSEKTMKSIEIAIGEHNSSDQGEIKRNTNTKTDGDSIVTSVHLSDKMALGEREKLPELLREDPKLLGALEGLYQLKDSLKDDPNVLADYKEVIKEYIDLKYSDSEKYSKEYVERIKDAVDKDISLISGKFDTPMSYIGTRSDSMRINEKGETELHVYRIHTSAETNWDQSNKQQDRQIEKLLEDLAVDKNDISDAINEAKSGGYLLQERNIRVVVEDISAEDYHSQDKEVGNHDYLSNIEHIEKGRAFFNEIKSDIAELKNDDIEDITYERMEKLDNGKLDFKLPSVNAFENMDMDERKTVVNQMISSLVINKLENYLENRS